MYLKNVLKIGKVIKEVFNKEEYIEKIYELL